MSRETTEKAQRRVMVNFLSLGKINDAENVSFYSGFSGALKGLFKKFL